MLSAATTKLSKSARKWFDLSTGSITRSWTTFKEAITNRFKRRVNFSAVMRKVDARKWFYSNESFQEYAMEKLALIHCLNLSESDTIQLLIDGIGSIAIKSTALNLALKIDKIDEFLENMHHITSAIERTKKSPVLNAKFERSKDNEYKKTDQHSKTDQQVKMEKNLYCVFCHKRNHNKEDCFKLKRKSAEDPQSPQNTAGAVTTEVDEHTDHAIPADNIVASVALSDESDGRKLVTNNSVIEINKIEELPSPLRSLQNFYRI
ncbi:uncharacterized protein LOC118646301 [Monomorium pharaonis]|uniref:uncharacterized protein LOC118646301 n=1 Tax=Monomorium pharaonis TaxID=307658 RepID=UPI001746AB31|nr:uncharacterized protein LOC118646301 [Monomorium pharaonis]